jgi:hypothetical protein
MREETYKHGKLNGETRWWDPAGKLVATGTYRDGLPLLGTFVEIDLSARKAQWVVASYEDGKKVSEDALPGGWWW